MAHARRAAMPSASAAECSVAATEVRVANSDKHKDIV